MRQARQLAKEQQDKLDDYDVMTKDLSEARAEIIRIKQVVAAHKAADKERNARNQERRPKANRSRPQYISKVRAEAAATDYYAENPKVLAPDF